MRASVLLQVFSFNCICSQFYAGHFACTVLKWLPRARSPRLPLNYGASLYDQTDFTKTDASPSSPSSPTVQLPKSGTIHDARLRSWLQRRRKTLEEKPGKPSTSNSERLVAVHRGSNALHLPFKWVPIQARELASNDVYFRGIHVNSLSLILKPGPDVDWKIMEMKSTGCQELGAIHCCIIGNTMIFCRGLVQCDESKKANRRILQLPPSMCPNGILTFAVLCSQREDESQDASTFLSLGRMKVFPDGWICIESVPPRCVIDLSGIRFAKGGGLPLTESVQVFSCSLRSKHLVMLQGKVSERFFDIWPGNPLVQIPPDFRPPSKCPFVVPGGRSGGFHLLQIGPSSSGGYIEWSDSVWNRDEIEVTAVSYETDSNVDCLPGTLINSWSMARRGIVLGDFQKFLKSKFGSLEAAWQEYDVYGDGKVDFTDFVDGCKFARFGGNVIRLWSMLDVQNHGVITFEDFVGRWSWHSKITNASLAMFCQCARPAKFAGLETGGQLVQSGWVGEISSVSFAQVTI